MSRTKTALVVLPFAIMAAVVVARVLIGPGAGLLPLLALGPAFAATAGGLRLTASAGAVALLLTAALIIFQLPDTTTTQEAVAFASVMGVTAASLLASVGRRRRAQELAEVRAIADVAQQVLLRPAPERVDSIRIAVSYASAAAGAQIGGDLYEAMPTPAGLRLIVGDVQGKGLSSVQTAATVLGAFREAAPTEPDLAAIAGRIEASVARSAPAELFVTAVLAEIPDDGSKVELLNCGHPPPLLLSDGEARFVGSDEAGSLPLGLGDLGEAGAAPHTRLSVPFAPGDEILFYTDGVSEARNSAGEFFPLASSASLREPGSPELVLRRLSHEVARHVGHGLSDDAAMMLVRREPGEPG